MNQDSTYTGTIEQLLTRWSDGDKSALDPLLLKSQERLRRMASAMLRKRPDVRRWQETDDVFQNAMVRLVRALNEVKPDSAAGFHGLVATQIRRELIDMARKYYGQEGMGRHHRTAPQAAVGEVPQQLVDHAKDGGTDPAQQAIDPMAKFHAQVEELSDDLKQVVNLLYYENLTQEKAAEITNQSVRTVRRRWREARLELGASLDIS